MLYDGVLLCSDFDGTLVSGNVTVSKENIDAIKMFQSKGGQFTLATGRTPEFIAKTVKDVTFNAPMISVNGASIFDGARNKEIAKIPLGDTSAFATKIFCHSDCQSVRLVYEDYSTLVIEQNDINCLEKFNAHINDRLFKLVYVFSGTEAPIELTKHYSQTYGDSFFFARSWSYSVEVLNKNATKGNMLKKLKAILPNVDLTVGVGDYENDIPLVSEADIGYAVANAIDEVKNAADRITVSCNEHAIAKIIYEL